MLVAMIFAASYEELRQDTATFLLSKHINCIAIKYFLGKNNDMRTYLKML
jgi:hypothetical protein